MHVVDERSASGLLSEAGPLFAGEREVEGNLVLGLLEALGRGLYAEPPPWLWSVRDGAALHGVALRTPPFPLTLSAMSERACDAVAGAIAQRQLLPLEINGPQLTVERVLGTLAASRPIAREVVNEMRLFELRSVQRPPPVPGTLRLAQAAEVALVSELLDAFEHEALPHEAGRHDTRARAERMLRAGGAFLWDDGGAVSFASFGRRVGTGASIGSVYTPPALRGRGYASALVAGLSQQLLDSGCRYTCLFTDLANPVSNSIYPKLGYRPVFDLRHVRVRAAS